MGRLLLHVNTVDVLGKDLATCFVDLQLHALRQPCCTHVLACHSDLQRHKR